MIPYFTIPPLDIPFPFGWTVFGLDHLSLQPFGFLVACGVLLGNWMGLRFARRKGLSTETLNQMVFPMVVIGFLGSHILSVAFYEPENLWRDWYKFGSGLSSYGGIISAVATLLVWTRWHKVSLKSYADSLAYGFLYAWLLGRAGCAVVHDHPGRLTDSWLALDFPPGSAALGLRYDLGLMEFFWLLFLVGLAVTLLWRFGGLHGLLAATLGLLYAPGRFFMESLRATDVLHPDTRYAGLTPAQYCSVLLALICIAWLYKERENFREAWQNGPLPEATGRGTNSA